MEEKEYVKSASCTFTMLPPKEKKNGKLKIYWECGVCGEKFTDNEEYGHAAKKHWSSSIYYTTVKVA